MKDTFDLIVVGGGFAGTAAAISAARQGVDVLLVERYNCLGGAASMALVTPFMRYWQTDPNTKEKWFLSGDLFCEMVAEVKKLPGEGDNIEQFDEEHLKLVLNRMAIKAGVTLLFNTTVTDVSVTDGVLRSVTAMSKATSVELFAQHFIDATGDAELATLAGCASTVGRAPDGLCQPMTLCFRMDGVDRQIFREHRGELQTLYKEHKAKGLIRNPREDVLYFWNSHEGVLHFNTTRVVKLDPTDPFALTQAEIKAREQVFEMQDFLRENVPGFERARVLSTAMHIGIRESRKVEGEYTLTQEDLLSLARFEDAIAVADYDIDIHNPEGSGTSHHYFKAGEWYEIPYRCLLPKGMHNLLVAGRCISATHEAQASFRIMPYCAELGQAAGTAVAVASATGKSVRDVDVQVVRQRLRGNHFRI